MAFHRLTVPTYLGGLPAGYDYINNALSGTPAPADGAKVGGTNAGTYFDAFGEDATSSNANRGNQALAQNCDALDDVVSGSLPVLDEQTYANAGGMASAVVTGSVFVGAFGTANNQIMRDRLILVTEKTSDKQLIVSGTAVQAALIHDGASANQVGQSTSGFYTNPTVNFNVTIPGGTDFRIVFARRSTLVSIVPSATDIARLILTALRSMYREQFSGGVAWADATANPAAPMDTQVIKMLADLTSTSGSTGAGKIYKGAGPAWADTTTPGAGELNGWLNAVVTALARTNTGNCGANKIGAEPQTGFTNAAFSLGPMGVADQIAYLLSFINNIFWPRTLAATGAMDGVIGSLDMVVFLNPSANFNYTLLNPATHPGRRIQLVDISGAMSNPAKSVTVVRYTGTNINGSANNYVLAADYGQWWLTSDGVGWYIG